ncbi:MAG: dihydropteroate synthase, partial [Thermoplasmata archaeon]|nr:dihydropteroate synthase [Thermoplasmata archaeon]
VLKDHDAPSIIMATDKKPGDPHTIAEITKALLKSITLAERKGYDTDKITIDPGIGLWVPTKVYKYNLDIINNLERFRCIGKPILVGISRKSFIGDVLGKPNPFDRLQGTLAATAIAVYNGAHIVRTHDVSVTAEIVKLSQRVRGRSVGFEGGGYEVMAIGNMGPLEAMVAMRAVGAAASDAKAMSEKTSFKSVVVNNLSAKEVAVIKKQMAKLGGEVAGPSGKIANKREDQSVIIFGTALQIKQLSLKLRDAKHTSLKKISKLLRKVLKDEDLEFRYKVEK